MKKNGSLQDEICAFYQRVDFAIFTLELTDFYFYFFTKGLQMAVYILYIYNSISEAHIIGRQLLCIQKTKLWTKFTKKKLQFFFFLRKNYESTSTAPSHYQLGSSLTISPSHHSDPSQWSGILSNIIGVISVSSRTLPVSYRPPCIVYIWMRWERKIGENT